MGVSDPSIVWTSFKRLSLRIMGQRQQGDDEIKHGFPVLVLTDLLS